MDASKRGKSASVHYGFSQKSNKSCYLLKRFGKEKNLIFQGLPGTKKGDLKADDKYIVSLKNGVLTGNKTAGAVKQKKVYNFLSL